MKRTTLTTTTSSSVLSDPEDHESTSTSTSKKEINQNEWRIINSHCFYFGIYSFNITRWKSIDSSELHTWCNSTTPRRFMAGYVKHSNLLMLVVENEHEVSKCGSIDAIAKSRPISWNARLYRATKGINSNNASNYSSPSPVINRYRKAPKNCYNVFPNESLVFQCSNSASCLHSGLFYLISTKYLIHLVVIYSFVMLIIFN